MNWKSSIITFEIIVIAIGIFARFYFLSPLQIKYILLFAAGVIALCWACSYILLYFFNEGTKL
jgi:hypothetical protein